MTLGRGAALVHVAVLAAVLQPQPLHVLLVVSGAMMLMLAWSRPAQTAAASAPTPAGLATVVATVNASPIAVTPMPLAQRPAEDPFGDMLANLSHEMRTPLNAVIGFAELMDAETFGPVGHPRYREYLSHIRTSGANLLKSTEDALALTEYLAGTRSGRGRQALPLSDLVADAWADLAHAPDAPSDVVSRAALGELEVLGDARVLRRALANLLTEARLRRGPAGEIAIDAHETGTSVIVRITAANATASQPTASLPLSLARMLLQSQDTTLSVGCTAGTWRAEIVLDRAAQTDIFNWCPMLAGAQA